MHGSSPSYLSELAATSLQSIPRLTLHSSSNSHILKTQQYAELSLFPTCTSHYFRTHSPLVSGTVQSTWLLPFTENKVKTFLYSQYIHGPQLKPASTFLTRVCLCACSCMCQCECVGMCITNVPMLLIQNHSGGDSLALYCF